MCLPLAVVAVAGSMAAAQAASTTMQMHDAAKAEGQRADNARLQAQEYVKQNNFNQANLSLSNRDAYEEAVQKMTANNMQYLQNKGALDTAIAESRLSGHSMDRLRNSVEQSHNADQMNVTNEYKRNYNEIFGQQVTSQQNAINAVNSLDQDAHKQSTGSQILGVGLSAVQGFVQGVAMASSFGLGSAATGASAAASSSAGLQAASSTLAIGSSAYRPTQSNTLR